MHPEVILLSRRRRKAVPTGLSREPPPDGIWIAGVVWQKVGSRKRKLLVEFGLPGWLGPLPALFRLDSAGLVLHAPITDHCSPPQFGPGPAGPQAPYSWSGFSRSTEVLSAKPSASSFLRRLISSPFRTYVWRRGSESTDFRLNYGVWYSFFRRFQHVSAFASLCGVMRLLDIPLDLVFG